MVCFVCLFLVFFGIDLLVLVIGEVNRKGRLQSTIVVQTIAWNDPKRKTLLNVPSCLACGLLMSNTVTSVDFRQLSLSTHTVLFEALSQSASMFGTGPDALQGLVLQDGHGWAFVVINTWPLSRVRFSALKAASCSLLPSRLLTFDFEYRNRLL